jgi:hypothetical protein
MPFESTAQQGYLHAHPEILGKKGLHEWDEATKGHYASLPAHVHHEHSHASYKVARDARKKE